MFKCLKRLNRTRRLGLIGEQTLKEKYTYQIDNFLFFGGRLKIHRNVLPLLIINASVDKRNLVTLKNLYKG